MARMRSNADSDIRGGLGSASAGTFLMEHRVFGPTSSCDIEVATISIGVHQTQTMPGKSSPAVKSDVWWHRMKKIYLSDKLVLIESRKVDISA